MSTTTPANWYPDPQVPAQLRYWDGSAWTDQVQTASLPAPVAGPRPPMPSVEHAERARPWYRKKRWWVGGVVLIVAIAAAGGGSGSGDPEPAASEPSTSEPAPPQTAPEVEPVEEEPVEPVEPVEPELTASQRNAVGAAENYLSFAPFSKNGLIRQLSSSAGDGYPKADAVFAVNYIEVDWKEQAVKAARNYLDLTSFSRDGLIQQLSSSAGDGYTRDQAVYAVNKVGL